MRGLPKLLLAPPPKPVSAWHGQRPRALLKTDSAVLQRSAMEAHGAGERLARVKEPFPHDFSKSELHSLAAVCDTLLPPVPGRLASSVALIDQLPNWAAGLMSQRLKQDKVAQIRLVLWLLSTPLGTFLLVGLRALTWKPFPWLHSFPDLPLSRREGALLAWSQSRLLSFRSLFKALKSVACSLYATLPGPQGFNPVLDALEYSPPSASGQGAMSPISGPLVSKSSGSDSSEHSDEFASPDGALFERDAGAPVDGTTLHGRPSRPAPLLRRAVVDAASSRFSEELALRGFVCRQLGEATLAELEEDVGPVPEARNATGEEVSVIECDAVILGSGCGGAVVAAQLAQAKPGSRILVLEKGRYFAGDEFSQLEAPSMAELFEGGGLLATEDGSLSVLAGTCVGGGSVVNWSASFRTPPHVRREWATEYGLKQFDSPEYDAAMDAVCARIGVNADNTQHNVNNSALREGCAALGYPCEPIPRNAAPPHACGWCHFGCHEGGKRCVATTWLQDAARNGTVILSSVRAERLLFSPLASPQRGRAQKVAGVVGVLDTGGHPMYAAAPRRVIVRAPLVVVACGSLRTPTVLLKSGLKNPNIGSHLRLHPVACTWGFFPEDDPELKEKVPGRNPEGGIMTLFSGVVGNWNSSGYGALIQTPCAHPGLSAAVIPWFGREWYWKILQRYPRSAMLITITRDSGRGRVYLDSRGQMALDYTLNAKDTRSMQDGVRASLNILRAAGAYEIGTCHQAEPLIFDCKEAPGEADFEAFLRRVEERGLVKNEVPIFSAHQLGSCPMGVDPKSSAVDENAESWEAAGLFLGDASIFPSPSGVNPMVSIESVAYLVGSRIAKRYGGGEFKSKSQARQVAGPKL